MLIEKHSAATPRENTPRVIGILSDTHGHIDPAAIEILNQSDLILHAGDIGGSDVLNKLKSTGTVVAVRGNMDSGPWSQGLPKEEFIAAGEILIYLLHDLNTIGLDPVTADIRVVISGHTHQPHLMKKDGVLYLNPGSVSFPRGGYKRSVALMEITGHRIVCRHIEV